MGEGAGGGEGGNESREGYMRVVNSRLSRRFTSTALSGGDGRRVHLPPGRGSPTYRLRKKRKLTQPS